MKTDRTIVLLVGLFLPGACSMLFGQRTSAEITGVLSDASGGVVPGAEIVVTNEATGIKRKVDSNELGYYTVSLLPPGSYRLAVTKDGFRPIEQTGITLQVDQVARFDFVLTVGATAQAVEVMADASKVDTQTSTLKEVVDARRIVELPLNGRDANQLIFLLPGVYNTNDTSGLQQGGSARGIVQPGVASNGARANMVSYSLDAAFHNDTYTNVSLTMPNPDALQEFSVQTNNYSAEYGRSAGAVVNAVTRSGTNTPHGNLFEFLRNNALNARNFFATTDDGLKRNQFGGSFGAPVYIPKVYNGRDRTFFFFSYQQTNQVQRPPTSSQVVLTAAQRNGDFSAYSGALIDPPNGLPFPGKQIPLARENVVSRNIINQILPLPSEPATGLLWYTVPNNQTLRQIVLKVDHQFSQKDTLTGRYLYNHFNSPENNSALLFATKPLTYTPSHNLSVAETHLFSSTLLNQLQFAMNLRTSVNLPVWTTGFADLGMKNIYQEPGTPEFSLSVSGAFSYSTTEHDITTPHDYTVSDILRWMRGRHSMSMGFEYRYQTLWKYYYWQLAPSISFNGYASGYGVADFFLGLPYNLVQSAYGEAGDMRAPGYGAFFQDNVRLSPRLTLNLGVRFEPFIPYVDAAHRVSHFRPGQQSVVYPNAPNGLLFPGDPGVPEGGTNSDINNFAPRVGFAWSPFANNRTSIRGGYGIFYDSGLMSAIANIFENTAPFGTKVNLTPPPGPFDDPYLGQNPFPMPFPPPKNIAFPSYINAGTYPIQSRTPYLQDWNLTVEREVHSNLVARVAYAGSKGTDLLQGTQLNASIYVPGKSTYGNANSRRPYSPGLASLTYIGSNGNSTYNSLQLSLDKRFSQNFTLLTNYTWAKSIDYGSGAGTLWPSYTSPWNYSIDRALSDFDRRHRFVTSGLWQLPHLGGQSQWMKTLVGDWSLAGALILQSGPHYSIRSGNDNSYSAVGLDRGDLVGNIDRTAGVDAVRNWFNRQAFAQNAAGTFGNSGRNIVPGPGLVSLNMSVSKNFKIHRESGILFRAEFYNLPNHTNLTSPRSDTMTSGTFGRITAADDPRILQFGLKYQF
jgi:hypothetical protein